MIFDPRKLLLIAGPCSLENEGVCRAVAEALVRMRRTQPDLNIVFKGSFDKANRTSLAGDRGTGMKTGLLLLAMVKQDYGFPVLTDVHETAQMAAVAEVCDVIQIPAFLCRQTDLLLAAAATGGVLHVRVLEQVADGDGDRDEREADHRPRPAFAGDEQEGQQDRPGVAPEDHEGIPRGEAAELAVAMLERVSRETRGPGHVEKPFTRVHPARQFDGRFEGRIEIRDRERALVDVDLRDFAAEEHDTGRLGAGDPADEQDAAVFLFEAPHAAPGEPRQAEGEEAGQGEKQEDLEFGIHGRPRPCRF